MLKYKLLVCAVCGFEFPEQAKCLDCPNCHTVYDLVEGKINNSATLVAPMDCKHRNRIFMQGASGSGQEENVTVCADCGEIEIYGRTYPNRESFHVRIVVWSQEIVNAISKAARLIPDQPGF